MKTNIGLLSIGQTLFNLGIVFLISAPFIASIFLIFSLLISFSLKGTTLLNNKWNYPIFTCFGFAIISTLKNTNFSDQTLVANSEIFISLLNWIPLLLIFVGINPFISSNYQKILFSKLIIISNIPLLISCFLQKHLEIYGPFSILNGLIIWFQRSPGETTVSVTGLFNNPNYTGFSLSLIIPFILYNISLNKNKKFKKIITILILFLTIYYLFSTQSRNALLNLYISFSLAFGIKIIFFTLLLLIISYPISTLIGTNLQFEYIFLLVKKNILEYQRLEIWQNAISFISQRPLLGWGGATFSALYVLNNGLYKSQHSHNVIFQIAQSYGIPCSILITTTMILLIIKASKLVFDTKNQIDPINKFWVISSILVTFHQFFDIVLYEGRLNIIFCLIIAGSRTILEGDNKNEDISKSLISQTEYN